MSAYMNCRTQELVELLFQVNLCLLGAAARFLSHTLDSVIGGREAVLKDFITLDCMKRS